MKNSSQKGWVLPTTLFGLTLVLATIRLLSVDLTGVTQMFGDIRRAHTVRQYAIDEILSAGEVKPLCEQRGITFEQTTLNYEVCGERRLPIMVAPPSGELPITRIDYDAIFAQAMRCPSTPLNAANPLEATPTASKECIAPATISGGFIILENIRGEATQVLSSLAQVSIIASPGRVSFTGALTLESDLVLVAGGDIEIGAIAAPPSQTRKVTILSALGGIRVGSVTPGVSVIAAGRSTIEVPENPLSPPFPLPPQRGYEIVGVRAFRE